MVIQETQGSPLIKLSVEDCVFEIKGNSFSENINEIYEKVLVWIDKEMPKIKGNINCVFNFYVSNSITYKNVLIMMTKFSELQTQGKNIKIIWFFDTEDEDNLTLGKDIEELFNLPVVFKERERNG